MITACNLLVAISIAIFDAAKAKETQIQVTKSELISDC